MVEPLSDDELAFLHAAFDLARTGDAAQLAAYHDHPDVVRALLARDADTSRVNDRGQTALGAAVFRRSEPSVRALLAAGADPGLGGRTALDIATFFELPDMLALLTAPQGDENT